jgi:hypothetical protein
MNDSTEAKPSPIPLKVKALTCAQIAVMVFFASLLGKSDQHDHPSSAPVFP